MALALGLAGRCTIPLKALSSLLRSQKCILKKSLKNVTKTSCATLVGKDSMAENEEFYKRLEPWPYLYAPFRWYHQIWEATLERFNSNSKIILVEGPIGAGKTHFAKKLAEEFDMMYMPEASLDMMYIDSFGLDMRDLDEELDQILPWLKTASIEEFYKNPHQDKTLKMQLQMYCVRHEQYCDGLMHLLNTGQGVVFDRSVYSDIIFTNAMTKMGYISPQAGRYLNDLRDETIVELLKPHLVVYLDIPVDLSMERIKERGIPEEVNSVVMQNTDYLKEIDRVYKTKVLKELSKESEVAIFDWSNFGDVEMVVEELERIDFDSKMALRKFPDWNWQTDTRFYEYRVKYDRSERRFIHSRFNQISFMDVPEMMPPDVGACKQAFEVYKQWYREKRYGGKNAMVYGSPWSRYSHFPKKSFTQAQWGTINNCLGY